MRSNKALSRLRKHAHILKTLAKMKPKTAKRVLSLADNSLIHCLCECSLNVIKGHVPMNVAQKTRLRRFRQHLRKLADKKISIKRKKVVLQKGGFLGALLAPIASVLGPLVGQLFGGQSQQ